MIVAGLAFKASAAPFHMWTPDVYEGAPTAVMGFMATATKTIAVATLLRDMKPAFAHTTSATRALLYYLTVYAAMNLGALAVVSVREREIGGPVSIGDLRGLGRD